MTGQIAAAVRVVRPGQDYEGQQGLTYFAGVSAETADSTGLCLHRLLIPPGGRANAHRNADHESAIYLLDGEVRMFWGEDLRQCAVMRKGDFVYIPPGVPHLPVNVSGTDPASALVARTDPNEQESVVLLPDLDGLPHLWPDAAATERDREGSSFSARVIGEQEPRRCGCLLERQPGLVVAAQQSLVQPPSSVRPTVVGAYPE